jgi:hypothetical protein
MLAASSADTEAETRDAAIVTMFYCLGPSVSELCGGRPGFAVNCAGDDLDSRVGPEGEGTRAAAGGVSRASGAICRIVAPRLGRRSRPAATAGNIGPGRSRRGSCSGS